MEAEVAEDTNFSGATNKYAQYTHTNQINKTHT